MTTLKGIFPNPKPTRRKNFIHENVKNLRRMEQFFHTKEVEDLQKLQLQKKPTDKYRGVGSRINSSFRGRKLNSLGKTAFRHSDKNLAEDSCRPERKLSAPTESKKSERRETRGGPKSSSPDKSAKPEAPEAEKCGKLGRAPSSPEFFRDASARNDDKDRVRCRNQGIQTLDTSDMETLYREGAIRYPSSRSSKNASSPNRVDAGQTQRGECPSPETGDASSPRHRRGTSSDRTDPSPVNDEQTDHVKLNKQKAYSLASKFATQLNNGVLPSNYRKGVVPKYIRERKEALQQRDEKIKAAATRPDCPDGHVPLPDDERKETLRMLKKHYQEYVNELNMMPIKTDTLRSQRRKMEIEQQLNKLEEGIKVFSRPKVYVKVNA